MWLWSTIKILFKGKSASCEEIMIHSSEIPEDATLSYRMNSSTSDIMELNSTEPPDTDSLTVSNDIPLEYQPSFVYVCLLFLLGVPGNSLVCAVYHKKWTKRRKASTLFILTLSWLDLINCLTTLPFEIALLLNFYSFDHPYLCKSLRWLTYVLNASSSIILLGIAVDRLIGVRYPNNTKMLPFGISRARAVILTAIAVALCTCWPSFILYGTLTTKFEGRVRSTCLIDNMYFQESTKIYPFAYVLYLIISNIIVDTTFIVLYTLIGLAVYRQSSPQSTIRTSNAGAYRHCSSGSEEEEVKRSPDHKKSHISFANHDTKIIIQNHENSTVTKETNVDLYESKRLDQIDEHVGEDDVFIKERPSRTKGSFKEWLRSARYSSRRNKAPSLSSTTSSRRSTAASIHFGEEGRRFGPVYHTRKTTFLLFIVTLVYILTFVPYCVIATIRLVDDTYLRTESTASKIIYQLFLRSYMLSMAVNPLIYSFLNRYFRQECLAILKRTFALFRRRSSLTREQSSIILKRGQFSLRK